MLGKLLVSLLMVVLYSQNTNAYDFNSDLEDLHYLADTAETNEDREEVEWQVEMARDKLNSMKDGLSSSDYNEYQAELDDIEDLADESVEDF